MEDKDVFEEISSIKNIMERSTRFISLSGLSGVLAGVYALVGAGIAYMMIPAYSMPDLNGIFVNQKTIGPIIVPLILLALVVLILSVCTGILLTIRKARKKGLTVWNPSSRALLRNGLLPLLTGGVFILILLYQLDYYIIAAACLIFYGLALFAASQFTYGDVKWLGICEITLGLIALAFPYYGLLFWAVGFGLLHILYGTIMYFKYDRENSAG